MAECHFHQMKDDHYDGLVMHYHHQYLATEWKNPMHLM
uniref:Uncharacterized protein n=1 Tax=Rhizophora mucronata TaxID=61149 RepID=A0A2P2M0V6_RHIMU